MTNDADSKRIFVSHAGPDRAWAEWVAWQLKEAGHSVELDVWDWAAGHNFIAKMTAALTRADRVVALFSKAFFEPGRFTEDEYTAVVAVKERGSGRLIPVGIEEAPVPDLLRPLLGPQLFDLDETDARRALLTAVAGPTGPPAAAPDFPRAGAQMARSHLGPAPRLPASLPRVRNIPVRNATFTGRDAELNELRDSLLESVTTVVQALHGWGGVGKSQLAIEYAHRFASQYDVTWWIDAEQPALIADQLAALAIRIDAAPPGASTPDAVPALRAHLDHVDRWLLIYDNAEDPAKVRPLIPNGPGHVLITSRNPAWRAVATPVEVDTFTRTESVGILCEWVSWLDNSEAEELAEALDDLPLAIAQAASLLAATGLPVAAYLDQLATNSRILDQGAPIDYPTSLGASVRLTADRLASSHPQATKLLNMCAFLGSEHIPIMDWATTSSLPASLDQVVGDVLVLSGSVEAIGRYGLARIDRHGVRIHRLVQSILRDRLTPDESATAHSRAEILVTAVTPGMADDPESWPDWARLVPHLLAIGPANSTNVDVAGQAIAAARYMLARGDPRPAVILAEDLYEQQSARLGADDPHTLHAAFILAQALSKAGDHFRARELGTDTLGRCRQIFGENHYSTLTMASNLAVDIFELGEVDEARKLDEDTLARKRRSLGIDHRSTLLTASNLASHLRALGDIDEARKLDEDTLARKRKILGVDHPSTLRTADNLAADLRSLGEAAQARKLDEDTLTRFRRVLGWDHPDTLRSADSLAADLRALGDIDEARKLDEDTLARKRKILGVDHPSTRLTAENLTAAP
ncbi:FxSxx-COOH system tetratricopeptide repeat protein [Streptomyces sp. NPDC002402]